MKKLIYLFAILVTVTGYSQVASGAATVNVNLAEIMALSVEQSVVDITVDEPDHYINGNSTLATNQLKITSTIDYQIIASVSGDFTNGTSTIPFNKVNLTLSQGTGGNSVPTFATALPLSTTPVQVATTDGGDLQRFINVLYTLQGGTHLLNLASGAYTATVTFEITAN